MRIALDISQLVYEGTGVARFTDGLLNAILHQKKSNHYWVFFTQTFRRDINKHTISQITDAGYSYKDLLMPPKIGEFFWNQVRLLPIDKLIPGLDWYISSDWTEPPALCKKATIVHDLIFKKYPETVDPYILSVMKRKIPLVAKECNIIFADSETTKKDFLHYFPTDETKIIVNYPGVSLLGTDATVTRENVKAKYKLNKPYFIAVGKKEPRKNLERLIKAFEKLSNPNVELLIVGSAGWGKELKESKNIRFTGYVSDPELRKLYELSIGLVFPSLYEGFGYPAVEAMQLGVPVAMSQTSSLEEIGRDTALFFDPENIDSIVMALGNLMDENRRKMLSASGRIKAKEYNWDSYLNTFITTLEGYNKV
jgi:glycosyltransferase involved in cell wall biosynthesis